MPQTKTDRITITLEYRSVGRVSAHCTVAARLTATQVVVDSQPESIEHFGQSTVHLGATRNSPYRFWRATGLRVGRLASFGPRWTIAPESMEILRRVEPAAELSDP